MTVSANKATKFDRLLSRLGACEDARDWARGKSLAEVWTTCERADWLLWLCAKMAEKNGWPTRQQVALAACDCAKTALKFVLKGEKRPAECLAVVRRWAGGEATLAEVRKARKAAAADAAAYAYAASAYDAAADAASAYDAAADAAAADAAAYAAAYAAAAYAAAAYAADAADAAAYADAYAAAAYAADAADAAAYAASAYAADYDAAAYAADAADAAAYADAYAAAAAKTLKDLADLVRSKLTISAEVQL